MGRGGGHILAPSSPPPAPFSSAGGGGTRCPMRRQIRAPRQGGAGWSRARVASPPYPPQGLILPLAKPCCPQPPATRLGPAGCPPHAGKGRCVCMCPPTPPPQWLPGEAPAALSFLPPPGAVTTGRGLSWPRTKNRLPHEDGPVSPIPCAWGQCHVPHPLSVRTVPCPPSPVHGDSAVSPIPSARRWSHVPCAWGRSRVPHPLCMGTVSSPPSPVRMVAP